MRSALTIAQALVAKGHDIVLAIPDGPGAHLVAESGLEYFVLPSPPLEGFDFNWKDFGPLKRFIEAWRPDILHSFLKGIPQLNLIARSTGAKVVATICGGRPQRYFPKMSPITVFSEELRCWLLSIGIPDKYIRVIPGRMSFEIPARDPEVEGFFDFLGIGRNSSPVIMMICRIDAKKKDALNLFFQAAEIYGQQFRNGVFINIGAGNRSDTERFIRREAKKVNDRVGRTVLVNTVKGSGAPVKYLHLATHVVGMGRSAFESMALGKPTLILSNEGFGGLVCEENISKLAFYNFTARHLPQSSDVFARSPENLVTEIIKLNRDPSLADRTGRFGRKYYETELDVAKAADEYEAIYMDTRPETFIVPSWKTVGHCIIRETLRTLWYGLSV